MSEEGIWRYEIVQANVGEDWFWMAKCYKGDILHGRTGISTGGGPLEALENLLAEQGGPW